MSSQILRMDGGPWYRAALCGALAGIYLLSGVLGLKLAFDHPSATPVWPPTGIALAGLLLLGYRVWPGVLLGAFLVNLMLPGPVWGAGLIAMGNTIEALLGAFLSQRFCRGAKAFDSSTSIFKYAFLAGMLSTATAATIGTTSVCLSDLSTWDRYGSIWLTWWLGDFGGALLVAPVIILWTARRRGEWDRRRVLEAAFLVTAVLVTSFALFLGRGPLSSRNYPVAFLALPVLGWAALRFGQRETATASLLLCAVAIWGTLRGYGPFGRWAQGESLLVLQAFMGVVTTGALVLAATVRERQGAETEVRKRHAELQETALALQENRERFRLIFESSLDALITMDSKGLITGWNRQAQHIFGWFPLEAVGRKLSETIIPERSREAHQRGLERYLATGEGPALNTRLEFEAVHRDKHEFPVELTITTFRSGGEVHFAGFVRDISDRRRAEREIRDLNRNLARKVEDRTVELREALKELEGFSYTVAHDLRAPLRAMSGFCQILVEDYAAQLDERAQDYARRIADSSKQMDRLIQELLDYSRVAREEVHLEMVDLELSIPRAVSSLSAEAALARAEIALDRPFPRVMGQVVTLDQVLANLLSNALKFVAAGVAPRIRVRSELRGERTRIWIEDNGIGIPKEQHDRIFGVFQRLHTAQEYPGSGIGLAIVRKAIERMRGVVGVESEPGKGSKFWIELPLAETHDASALHRPSGRG